MFDRAVKAGFADGGYFENLRLVMLFDKAEYDRRMNPAPVFFRDVNLGPMPRDDM